MTVEMEVEMSKALDQDTFTGAHPTNQEFYDQLLAWGFTQRREDGVHLVLRGPHGGTLRILRSLTGRADAQLVQKAARLAEVTVTQFWTRPWSVSGEREMQQPPSRAQRGEGHDSVTSLVLSVHVKASRPLGFDDVVKLCRGRVRRSQVRHASSLLYRDGDLDRVRSGVYQWHDAAAQPAADGSTALRVVADPGQQPVGAEPHRPTNQRSGTVELFEQLFPHGVTMTADLFADLQQWAELTEKLTDQTRAS